MTTKEKDIFEDRQQKGLNKVVRKTQIAYLLITDEHMFFLTL